MKTSELTGAPLDWAVTKAEGLDYDLSWYSPSTKWAQGGPIIERERMVIAAEEIEWVANLNHTREVTYTTGTARRYCTMRGETALIASMRCYVASKLGDEVDLPEELCDAKTT